MMAASRLPPARSIHRKSGSANAGWRRPPPTVAPSHPAKGTFSRVKQRFFPVPCGTARTEDLGQSPLNNRPRPTASNEWSRTMHGQITRFSEEVGYGVIEADDGSKYRFAKSEVVNLNGHLIGHSVDFVVAARRPKHII